MEPVVRTVVYKHILPLLITDCRLRNFGQKLGLELFKAKWVFARFGAVRVDCLTNDVTAPIVSAIREADHFHGWAATKD